MKANLLIYLFFASESLNQIRRRYESEPNVDGRGVGDAGWVLKLECQVLGGGCGDWRKRAVGKKGLNPRKRELRN